MKSKNSKEEEEEEEKEIDEIAKIIENNLKLETTINKSLNESSNDIIKKYDWSILEDHSFHFEQSIETVWEIIQSFMNNSQLDLITIKNCSNFCTLGAVYEGEIFHNYKFKAKVIKLNIFTEIKKIEWIFYVENGGDFRLKIKLHKVTEDNSTVIHLKSRNISSIGENFIYELKEKSFGLELIKNIEEKLKKDSKYLSQYESGILLGTMEEIWDIITDNSKLVLIAPNNDCFIPVNINKYKEGEFLIIPFKIKNIEGYLEGKLNLKQNKEDCNQWQFSYSILGGGPFKIIKQTMFVNLIKINKNETHLSIFTKIYDKINVKLFKCLEQKKKYVIASLKNYFEYFSSPKNDI